MTTLQKIQSAVNGLGPNIKRDQLITILEEHASYDADGEYFYEIGYDKQGEWFELIREEDYKVMMSWRF